MISSVWFTFGVHVFRFSIFIFNTFQIFTTQSVVLGWAVSTYLESLLEMQILRSQPTLPPPTMESETVFSQDP